MSPADHPLDRVTTIAAEHEECETAWDAEPVEYDDPHFVVICPTCAERVLIEDLEKTA